MAKKSYGEQNGKNPKQSKLAGFRQRMGGAGADTGRANYETATAAWILAAIVAVTKEGGAIQFGYSKDGGVYSVVILMDGEIERNYVKQSEGIDEFCEQLYSVFTTEPAAGQPEGT